MDEVLNIRVDGELLKAVELVAAATGKTKSAVARYALLAYMEQLKFQDLFDLPEPSYLILEDDRG